MEGYINENRWVDLSGLPRTKNGKYIDWKASKNHSVDFLYNGIKEVAHIIDVDTKSRKIKVFIKHWTVEDGEDIIIQAFQNCNLHKLYNKISVLAPQMIKYLADINDSYKYPPHHNNKLVMKCPYCGTIRECKPSNFIHRGFNCPSCGDGVSYPNKLMFNTLTQLGIDFKNELSRAYAGFEWCQNYRYDFYFELGTQKYIVEMDGHFHNSEHQKKRDKEKNQLAIEHNIEIIHIDCKYDKIPFDYIVNNIKKSKLSKILQLELVDWNLCDTYASSSLVRDVCKLWEYDLYDVGQIMNTYNLSKTTVRCYLLRGKELGLCPSYNKEESRKRSMALLNKHVGCCVDGEVKYVFFNANEVEEFSIKIGAPRFSARSVQLVCADKLSAYHGVVFRYVDNDTYEVYKNTLNNDFNITEYLCQEHNIKPIAVIDNSEFLYVFKNAAECSRLSCELFGRHYNTTNIHRVLLGQKSSYLGKQFKHITKEEYRQYKMIENNNIEVIKGGNIE